MTHDFSSTTCCPTPTVGVSQSLMASCTSSSMSSMTYAPSPGYPTLVPFSLSNHQHPHQQHPHPHQHPHHPQASSPMFAVSPMSSINSQMNSMNHMNSMSGTVASMPNKNGTISLAAVSVPLSFYLGAPPVPTSLNAAITPTSNAHPATAASLSTYSTPVLDVSLLRAGPTSLINLPFLLSSLTFSSSFHHHYYHHHQHQPQPQPSSTSATSSISLFHLLLLLLLFDFLFFIHHTDQTNSFVSVCRLPIYKVDSFFLFYYYLKEKSRTNDIS